MIVVGVAAALATSCAGTGTDSGSDSERREAESSTLSSPTTTGTTARTSAQAPGLPAVTFDPCTTISDEILLRFGLDPADKQRNDMTIGAQDIVACNVMSNHHAVGFIAQNTPWEDTPLDAPGEPISINGRESIYVPNPFTGDDCALLMRTSFGAVIIDTFARRGGDTGAGASVHACDGIIEMAEAIEPLIDGVN